MSARKSKGLKQWKVELALDSGISYFLADPQGVGVRNEEKEPLENAKQHSMEAFVV